MFHMKSPEPTTAQIKRGGRVHHFMNYLQKNALDCLLWEMLQLMKAQWDTKDEHFSKLTSKCPPNRACKSKCYRTVRLATSLASNHTSGSQQLMHCQAPESHLLPES